MIERLRCHYVRTVILLFSVTIVEKLAAAHPKRTVSFSNEHVVQKKDSIFWEGDTIPTRKEPQSNEIDHKVMSWKRLRSNLFSNDEDYDTQLKENRLCDIGDGYVYREGQKLETFDTRCGSIDNFPCYCDPDLEPPISCPYCGFHSPPPAKSELQADANVDRKSLSNAEDFFCLKSGETSGPFRGTAGSLQVCSCAANGFFPNPSCAPPKTQITTIDDLRNNDDEEDDESIPNDSITFHKDSPSSESSNSGSSDEAIPDYSMTFHKNSPSSKSSNSGSSDEAIPNYSITFHKDSPSSRPSYSGPSDEAIPDYSITYNSPSPAPLYSGSSDNTNLFVRKEPGAFDEPAIPEPVQSNNDIDLPAKRTVLIDKSAESNGSGSGDVCTIVLEGTGETKTFQRGESYGTFLPSKCSNPEEFPCFCNPDLVDQAECPHCGFLTDNGTILCAHHEKTLSFRIPGGGGIETCTCLLSSNPAYRPIEACTVTSHTNDRAEKSSTTYKDLFVRDDESSSAAHNIGDQSDGTKDGDDTRVDSSRSHLEGCEVMDPTTGNNLTVPIGDSFADYLNVEGACGDGIEWPAYCSASWSETASSAATNDPPQHIPYVSNLHKRNNLSNKDAVYVSHRTDAVYPYCVHTNTLSNMPVCARSNDGVVYTTDKGERIECFCTYSSLSGPISTCYPYPREETTNQGSTRSYNMVDPDLKFSGQQEQLLPPEQPPTYSPVVTPTPPPPTFAPSTRAPAVDGWKSGSIGRNTVGGCSVVFGSIISTVVWMLAAVVTSTNL